MLYQHSIADELSCSLFSSGPYHAPTAVRRCEEAVEAMRPLPVPILGRIPRERVRAGTVLDTLRRMFRTHGSMERGELISRAHGRGVAHNSIRSALQKLRTAKEIEAFNVGYERHYRWVK